MKKIQVGTFSYDGIIKRFRKNPKELESFFYYIVKQYKKTRDLDVFLDSLKIVVMANRGAATNISRTAKINRSGIYKALSNHTKPRIDTFISILNGLGWDFDIVKKAA